LQKVQEETVIEVVTEEVTEAVTVTEVEITLVEEEMELLEDVLIAEEKVIGLAIVLMKMEEIDVLTAEKLVTWHVNAEKNVETEGHNDHIPTAEIVDVHLVQDPDQGHVQETEEIEVAHDQEIEKIDHHLLVQTKQNPLHQSVDLPLQPNVHHLHVVDHPLQEEDHLHQDIMVDHQDLQDKRRWHVFILK